MRMKSASMEKPEDKDPGGGARQTEHHVTVVICQWRQGGRHVQRLRVIGLVCAAEAPAAAHQRTGA